ncbi:hypothetical protein A9996_18560 [Gelidibacter algens]|uniref:hypothetical protein n=1 Tax=Gelidibacter algens TaxID=49280 RepID=UPI0008048BF8|nr:hypothetical protein [Gelidibacter algens]OBX21041.1 hypothetical protein A9996_18560 [Gelidibacter algens]
MNKFKFVRQLLENEKLNPNQKERFLKLISKELADSSNLDEQIFNEVKEIKEKIRLLEGVVTGSGQEHTKPSNSHYPKIHNARSLVGLMNQFSDNSKALKYTTHSWEHGRFQSYEDFLKKVKEEWNDMNQELKELNPRLHGKISNFLFNEKLGKIKTGNYYHVWGEKKLKFGWASGALQRYMNDNDADPFSCPIPDEIKILDKKHNFLLFDHYVSEFKNEIEIREDNSALVNLINNLWTEELNYDFTVNQENTEGVSFFTDVPYLKSVLKIVFGSFKKRSQFPNIIFRVDQNFEKKYLELSISQLDSKCNRSIDDPKIICPTGGDFSTLIENLKNLADFSVIGVFRNGALYKVNYLSSNENVENVRKTERRLSV